MDYAIFLFNTESAGGNLVKNYIHNFLLVRKISCNTIILLSHIKMGGCQSASDGIEAPKKAAFVSENRFKKL